MTIFISPFPLRSFCAFPGRLCGCVAVWMRSVPGARSIGIISSSAVPGRARGRSSPVCASSAPASERSQPLSSPPSACHSNSAFGSALLCRQLAASARQTSPRLRVWGLLWGVNNERRHLEPLQMDQEVVSLIGRHYSFLPIVTAGSEAGQGMDSSWSGRW